MYTHFALTFLGDYVDVPLGTRLERISEPEHLAWIMYRNNGMALDLSEHDPVLCRTLELAFQIRPHLFQFSSAVTLGRSTNGYGSALTN